MSLLFEELVKKNNSPLLSMKRTISIEPKINLQEEILQIFKNLAEDSSWSFETLERKDTSYATHGFHRYPAKFIPQLARRCIEKNTKTGKN